MSDLEHLRTVDGGMFGRSWWRQPLPACYASIDAHLVGLLVQVEVMQRPQHRDEAPCITWRGTAAQFQATKTFPKGVSAKRPSGRYVTPGQLRGTVYPDGEDRFLFVIEFCNYHNKGPFARHAKEAQADESYLGFRDAVMAGFPLVENESEL